MTGIRCRLCRSPVEECETGLVCRCIHSPWYFTASVDTLPKGEDAKQASCASKGSAVGAAETPNTPMNTPTHEGDVE